MKDFLKKMNHLLTGSDNAGTPPNILDTYKAGGYQSSDFPGVSPFTREGSFWFIPGWVNPQPHIAGTSLNFMKPLEAGLLRLPELVVGAQPNTVGRGVNADAGTPAVRKATFPVVPN